MNRRIVRLSALFALAGALALINAKNTIIARNSATSSRPDFSGTLTSQRYNLIGDGTGATITPMKRLLDNPLTLAPVLLAPTCTPPPPGMISWWPGEGNANDIRAENNGTLNGSPTFPAGEVGQAFGLNGTNQFVSIPDSPSLRPTNLTIDAWVNPTDLTQDRAILIKSALSSGGNDFAYGLRVLTGGHAEGRITDAGGAFASVVSTSVLSINQFQHIALTYDGAALKLYVNGVLDATTATNLTPVQNTNPVSIGVWQSVSSGVIQYWFGRIDEVELFNRALIDTEIQGIFNAGSAGKCKPTCTPPPSGMVSWWQGDGNANDIRGGNNGTLQGSATFAAGKVGQAFSFNGTTDYVSVPDNANLYPQAGSFTVDAWIRTTKATGFQVIITHYECAGNCPSNSANSVYDLYVHDDKLEGEIRDTTGADQVLTGTHTVTDGKFHHVAMLRDMEANPKQMVLYLDGNIEVSATLIPTGVLKDDDGEADPVTIGTVIQNNVNGCGCPIEFFSGVIDEVEYFSRALSLPEIQGIFNADSAGKCKVCVTPPSGMVGWWPSEGNANDISGGNNNGALQGGAMFAPGKVGQAFSFDASTNSGVIVPSSSSLNPTDAITLDAWVRPSSFPNGGPAVIRKDTNNVGTTQYSLNVGDGSTTGVVHCNIGGFIGVTGGLVPLNQWSHIACTYDRQNLRAYLNGVEVVSAAATQAIPTPSPDTNLAIGKEDGFTDRNFDGLIDEVEIFNRALTQTEIQGIFNADSAGKCRSPMCSITGADAVCPGSTGNSYSGPAGATLTYSWSISGNGAISGSNTGQSVSVNATTAGSFTLTLMVTDTSTTLSSTCMKTVTVNADTQNPVIGACPSNIVKSTDPNVCTAVATFAPPTATDNCTPAPTVTCSPASGSTFNKGVTTVTCTATDSSNNTSSCSFTVTVTDTQAPTITCPSNTTASTSAGCAVVNYPAPTVSDNCSGATASCSPPSGACFPLGTTTVNCTATDAAGNQAPCSFTVTVNQTACTITCPPNQTANTGPGATQCCAVVNYPAPATTGSCGTVTCGPASGSCFPAGTTTVTCTSTAGPSCTFTVTVTDNTPPVITCPADITTAAAASCPIATSSPVNFTVTASDNCPGVTIVCKNQNNQVVTPGQPFPVGTTTVTCTATDASGNTATCNFNVSAFSFCLQDETSPGNVVLVSAQTGDYTFCCGGVQIASGRGTLTTRGCIGGIDHFKGDRKVHIEWDTSANNSTGAGTAFVQKSASGKIVCQITDRNMSNNTCQCGGPPPVGSPTKPPKEGTL